MLPDDVDSAAVVVIAADDGIFFAFVVNVDEIADDIAVIDEDAIASAFTFPLASGFLDVNFLAISLAQDFLAALWSTDDVLVTVGVAVGVAVGVVVGVTVGVAVADTVADPVVDPLARLFSLLSFDFRLLINGTFALPAADVFCCFELVSMRLDVCGLFASSEFKLLRAICRRSSV